MTGAAAVHAAERYFVGARGEVGELMRTFDWSTSELGPVERWPQSLKTTVGVMLGSRFPMALWWGPRYLHLYNDAFRPILRGKHPAALGKSASEVWPEVWAFAGPLIDGVLAGGPATWTEDRQIFINTGERFEEAFFTFSFSPVPGDDGRVGGVLDTVTETTAKVQGERALQLLHALSTRSLECRSEDEAWRMVLDVLHPAQDDVPFAHLYVVQDDGQAATHFGSCGGVGTAPPARAPLSGADDDGGWPLVRALSSGGPVVVPDVRRRFGELRGGPQAAVVERGVVLPVTPTPGGRPRAFLALGVSPHRALDERYLQLLQGIADRAVGALRRAESFQAKQSRITALAALDQAKTSYFSNVSHEFRTPLTLMLGPLEDALRSRERRLVGPELELVHRNTVRLQLLANSLLEFARVEAGYTRALFVPVDLADFTTQLAGGFRSAIERVGLRFEVDCPPLPAPVYVDRDHWERVVLNLLSNALKFTLKGFIRLELRWHGEEVTLEVRDSGGGIPAEDLPKLFQRFHRVERAHARTHEGSGIGLALVQALVQQHGGRVDVSSEVGVGSSFRVTLRTGREHLPFDRVAEAAEDPRDGGAATPYVEEALSWSAGPTSVQPTRRESHEVGEGTAPSERVLVVDDNADLRHYLGRLLSAYYVVEEAADGEEALALMRRSPPALVLSDVMMPRLDGFGLLREVRKDRALGQVPFILLSARAGEEATVEGLDSGADDYLVKPFVARELLARVRSQLAFSRERQVFERFFNLSLDLVCIASPQGHFLRVNPAFSRLGYPEDELLSRPFLDFVHPDDVPATLEEVARLARGEATVRFENRYRCKDGSYCWLSWTSAPDSAGTLYAIARDVTEEKESRVALSEAKEAAERANRELEAFSYSVAHDLRSPLRGIDGFSQALLEDCSGQLDESGQRYLRMIRESAQLMAELIDDLLTLAQVSRSELHWNPVDLSALARGVIERLALAHPERTVELVCDNGLEAHGDERLLRVMLENLLGNAWKFSSKQPEARIEFRAVASPAGPAFQVKDNGAGFDMRYAAKLFGVFQRLHAAHEFEGTGVGLATVQRIVHRHGGSIWAQSAPGAGATFTFTLGPRERAS
ncbi:MAG: response regulator [Myxococcaceae bacterium]|nr:response regulator [Myxococcaceae bacterium]